MVEDLDGTVGEVMSALRRSGQANDTLVLFISDNGRGSASRRTGLLRREGVVAGGRCRHPDVAELAGSAPAQTGQPLLAEVASRLDRPWFPGSAPEASMTTRADLDTVSTQAL
jgi:arylsulfatase A-like enzyme